MNASLPRPLDHPTTRLSHPHAHVDAAALSRLAAHFTGSTERLGALTHAVQSQALTMCLHVEAVPVVLDAQLDYAVVAAQAEMNLLRRRMPHRVAQRFLRDTVQCRFQI